jgi:hypothetical protein
MIAVWLENESGTAEFKLEAQIEGERMWDGVQVPIPEPLRNYLRFKCDWEFRP